MSEEMRNTVEQAIRELKAQKRLLKRYDSLALAQSEGMKLMSDGMIAVMQSCAKIAELTDDPEVIEELRKILKVGEAIQHDAKLLTSKFTELEE